MYPCESLRTLPIPASPGLPKEKPPTFHFSHGFNGSFHVIRGRLGAKLLHFFNPSAEQELPDLGNYFLPPKHATISLGSESEPSDHEGATTTKPVLEELGILYAHRNEDIINVRPNSKRKMVGCISQEASEAAAPLKRRRLDDKGGIESGSSSKDWKRIQFSRLAESMGLSELEFRKWVLPATPSERENVLQDYRKRMEKRPNG